MTTVRLRKNILDRWILVHGEGDRVDAYAWSGSRFVPIDREGLGTIVQISNFDSREEAKEYAMASGFMVAT